MVLRTRSEQYIRKSRGHQRYEEGPGFLVFSHSVLSKFENRTAFIHQRQEQPADKDDRKQNCPDQAFHFVLKVHKLTHNVERFHDRHAHEDGHPKVVGWQRKGDQKLKSGDDRQDNECPPDGFCVSGWWRNVSTTVVIRVRCICHVCKENSGFNNRLNQVEEGKYEHPNQVNKVPVQTNFLNHLIVATTCIHACRGPVEDQNVQYHS